MISSGIAVVLERVCECPEPIIAYVLQITACMDFVREIQTSLFKTVNLFLNGERTFGVLHD